MLIPRLMMRKAQIYRIQNLNIFRFCHTAPLPHSGADFPFNILNILGVTPLHREFWNVYLNMSRAIEIYPSPLSISMDMRLFGSIQPHAICNVHFSVYFYFWLSQPYRYVWIEKNCLWDISNSWRNRKYLYQAENICGLIWEREPKIVANGSDNGLQRLPASFDKNLPQMAFNRKLSSRGVNINQLEQKEVSAGTRKIAAFR